MLTGNSVTFAQVCRLSAQPVVKEKMHSNPSVCVWGGSVGWRQQHRELGGGIRWDNRTHGLGQAAGISQPASLPMVTSVGHQRNAGIPVTNVEKPFHHV